MQIATVNIRNMMLMIMAMAREEGKQRSDDGVDEGDDEDGQ